MRSETISFCFGKSMDVDFISFAPVKIEHFDSKARRQNEAIHQCHEPDVVNLDRLWGYIGIAVRIYRDVKKWLVEGSVGFHPSTGQHLLCSRQHMRYFAL